MNPVPNSQYLRAAKGLISTPEGWCQGSRAKNNDGWEVDVLSPSATQYCAKGAILAVTGFADTEIADLEDFMNRAKTRGQMLNYVGVNEIYGHEEIMKTFDAAILIAEAEEALFNGVPTQTQKFEHDVASLTAK